MKEWFQELMERAEGAFVAGDLQRSLKLYEEAERGATLRGEQELADRAYCSLTWIHIELDTAEPLLPRLKRILLGSEDLRNRWLAAHHIAVAKDIAGETASATSYAQRAKEIASRLDDTEMIARSANLSGSIALRCAEFESAEECFRQALSLHGGQSSFQRIMEAQEKDNFGYVLICTDRIKEGVRYCEEARAELEAAGAQTISDYLPQTLQDLCYGYLLNDNLDLAQRHGERALDLAAAAPDPLVVKNCLFLLSEVAVRRGDSFRARRYLRELTTHYPEVGISEELIDVFLATDLTTVVNLRG